MSGLEAGLTASFQLDSLGMQSIMPYTWLYADMSQLTTGIDPTGGSGPLSSPLHACKLNYHLIAIKLTP